MRYLLTAIVLSCLIPSIAAAQIELPTESFEFDPDHRAAGLWIGNLSAGEKTYFAAIDIVHTESGEWKTSILAPELSGAPIAPAEFMAGGPAVRLSIQSPVWQIDMDGQIGRLGQRLQGKLTLTRPDTDPIQGVFKFARVGRVQEMPDATAYIGSIRNDQGETAEMAMLTGTTPAGNTLALVNIPQFGLQGFPLVSIERDGSQFTGKLPLPPALPVLSLTVADDGSEMTGTLAFGRREFGVELLHADVAQRRLRPQEPRPPFPYTSTEITIQHDAGHTLAGTLLMPEGSGPHPVAVFATGAGPQNRDEATLFGHRPFLVLADHLARHGIGSLRCDDRGAGRSTGDNAGSTTMELATDVSAQIEFLQRRDDVRKSAIGIIGHGEGGVLAAIAASRNDDVAYIIMMASPGVTGAEVQLEQIDLMVKAMGHSEDERAKFRQDYKTLVETVLGDKPHTEKLSILQPILAAQLQAVFGVSGDQLQQLAPEAAKNELSRWNDFYLQFDPRPVFAKVKCPVLAIGGTLDVEVSHDQNLKEIEQAVQSGGGTVTTKSYEGRNHQFQKATTGALTEYAAIKETIDEQVLVDVTAWIRKQLGLDQ